MNINSKIKIEIKDNFKYEIAALYLDRNDVLKEIEKGRKSSKINSLRDRDEYDSFESLQTKIETQKHILKYGNALRKISKYNFSVKPKNNYDDHINRILHNLKRGKIYFNLTKYAMICGVVRESDIVGDVDYITEAVTYSVNPRSYAVFNQGLFDENELSTIRLDNSKYAIIVSPHTKKEDVIQTYEEMNKQLQKVNKFWVKFDTATNIKRDREWYWLHKEGLSYGKIKQIAQDSKISITRDGVIKAINQYVKKLSV